MISSDDIYGRDSMDVGVSNSGEGRGLTAGGSHFGRQSAVYGPRETIPKPRSFPSFQRSRKTTPWGFSF